MDGWFLCPICDDLVEPEEAIQHILKVHRTSGLAYEIRRAVDQQWVATR